MTPSATLSPPSAAQRVSPARIMNVATQYWQSALLLAAAKLDLFSQIPEEGISAEDLAKKSGSSFRQLELMLNALAAHGFLDMREGGYFCAPDAAQFLDKSKPGYLGGALAYAQDMYGPWGELARCVREGRPVSGERHLGNDPGQTRNFVRAMHERALQIGPALTRAFDLTGRSTLLDLGGGPGTLSLQLTRRFPGLRATVVDLAPIAEEARRILAEADPEGAVRVIAGSYLEDLSAELGDERFDAVLLSGQMHQETAANAGRILDLAARRLAPGGLLYLVDIMTDADKSAPAFATLFGINMALTRPDGGVHGRGDMEAAIEACGLQVLDRGTAMAEYPYTWILATRK